MKIAYIWQREDTDLDLVNGPNLHVRAVVDRLRRRGHRVRMVTYKGGQPAWSDDWHEWHEISSHRANQPWFRLLESAIRGIQSRLMLPYARLFDSVRFVGAMLPAVRNFDLIYERHDVLASAGVMAGRYLSIPTLVELNGDAIEEYSELGIALSRGQWWLIRQMTHQTFRSVAHIITVSEPLRQATIRRWGLPQTKVSTVANGVDVEVMGAPEPAHAMTFPLLPNGSPVIIHIGSFQPWHSLDFLVDAFAEVAAAIEVSLLLVGDGPQRRDIEEKVAQLKLADRVIFTGNVPHTSVGSFLASADVAVLAHRPTTAAASGTPLKLLEYMAAGKAIVAPRLENLTAVIQDDYSALFFEPGNAKSLASALMELIKDPTLRGRLGKAAQGEAFSRYSWDNTVDKLEQIFISQIALK